MNIKKKEVQIFSEIVKGTIFIFLLLYFSFFIWFFIFNLKYKNYYFDLSILSQFQFEKTLKTLVFIEFISKPFLQEVFIFSIKKPYEKYKVYKDVNNENKIVEHPWFIF